jgi:hypothetical protein
MRGCLRLQGEIFAAFCLGVGIIWESDKYKGDEIKKVAFLLVMLGVVFETIFSVLLFASEEKISEIQKSKIIELERKLAPRTLEPWQRQMLVDLLSPAPKGRVIIKPNFVDMEATVFANQITQALIEAGFQGVGDAPLNVLSFGQPGIQIAFKEPGNLPPHALSIIEAFRKAEIEAMSGGADWVPDANTVVIAVGRKP